MSKRKEAAEPTDEDLVLQAIDELAQKNTELAEAQVEVEQLQEEIEKLREEAEQANDQWRRSAAEFQNYRRRTESEKAQMVAFGKSLVVSGLLDVVDDFERSLEATREAEAEFEGELSPIYESLKSGVELIYRKLSSELERLEVVPIDAKGQPFNENEHEALMQQEAPEGVEPGTVLDIVQPGYKMGDRVLRHAKVVVAS
ncbi:MAG: nucleotide exchange factor GrpE [Bacteroidetes bacterium CG12_big_fil_rev_8_21_14_0_65_60_17]|nr:MAG: nucleotide exchange factor GrpE [Bacteroidetes bacterium CG12_big_fil_rev_8_21_14_0_65_60_17]